MMSIIYLSDKPLQEKHCAYRELIADYPDMAINERCNFAPQESLHAYLQTLIAYEERAVGLLTDDTEGGIFEIEVNTRLYGRLDDNDVFSTFEKARAALYEEYDWDEDQAVEGVITKRVVDRHNETGSIGIDRNGRIVWVTYYEEGPDLPDMLYFDLPVPFKKGDLVTTTDGVPRILVWLPHWLDSPRRRYEDYVTGKRGDGSDMNGTVCYIEDGTLCYDSGPPHMIWRMQYFHGELQPSDAFLKYLSAYMKGEMDNIQWLLAAHEKCTIEYQREQWNRSFGEWFDYVDERIAEEKRIKE